ncbi:MAG: trypsin-like peptidase domain-containing protein [Solirubrobacterales bacterium]|nr:trypsin-like peptidase domain-containing protein [Solirubrobacterales bacterium]
MFSRAVHRTRRAVLWVFAAVILVAAGVAGALIANALNNNSTASTAVSGPSCDVTSVAQQKLPTVVTIMARGATSGGVGSGEVIRSNGYILTNNHVILPAVAGGQLEVVFENGNTGQASIVGRDALTDLAVIQVHGVSNLRTISIGNSSDLRIGQPVVALGAPLGLSSTVTSGIVSALARTVHVPGEGSQSALLIDAVQTDAAINPGNSGGALVDCSGALVGVPTAGATIPSPSGESGGGSIGLGFAIPVNLATKVAEEIIDTGRVSHAFLGIQAQPTSSGAAGQGEGLWVAAVTAGGPAASAGLQAGDVIKSIDGSPAVSTDQLMALTLTKRAGDRAEIGYARNGSQATTTITLGARS